MQNNSENIDIYGLITKQLSGEITSQEASKLDAWITEDEANKQMFEAFHQSWEMTDSVGDLVAIDVDKEWARMESIITKEEKQQGQPRVISHETFKQRRNFSLLKIAAVFLLLLIPAGTVYLFFAGAEETIATTTNIVDKTMPDGTVVTLYRNATITYPKNFEKGERKLKLKGEAFFNVVPDKTRPFIVQAGEVSVKVLGTAFNVNTQLDNDWIEIVVESGKVLVYTNGGNHQEVNLTAGERGLYNKQTKELKEEINEDVNFNSWKTKKLKFQNKRFAQVIKTLNKVYGSTVVIEGNGLKKCRIAVDFENQTLEETLEVLQGIVDFEVVKENGKLLISGEGC